MFLCNSGGTIRGKGGPTVVMLSAVGVPPGLSMVAVHGPGEPSMTATCGRGDQFGGRTIGCVTDQIS